MRRVAIIGTRGYPSYYGGFETAVRHLAPSFADAGWEVTVYGRPGQERDDDPTLDSRIIRRTTRGTESKSLSTLTFGLTATVDAVRRRPGTALVMNCANGFWLPLLKAAGIRTVVNVDGLEWQRAKWGRLARTVFRAGAWCTARFADQLVFDAEAIRRYWEREFGVTGVMIPYGGTAVDALPLSAEDAHLSGRQFALVVARFVPENTVPEFLAAAERIAERYPVVIVGSSGYGGELDDQAAALAERNADVHWLGHVADDTRLLALWHHAGAYFHGHSVGGTNPALVQAMHCGAPVVARDTVYNREVLEGTDATLVEADPTTIAAAVADLLEDEHRQRALRRQVRTRARAAYTWDGVCSAYERVLREPSAAIEPDRSHDTVRRTDAARVGPSRVGVAER